MNAVVETKEVQKAVVFYSQFVGFAFLDSDAISKNPWLKQELASMSDKTVTRQDGKTSFNIESANLGYFMHMMYVHMPEGFVLQADWDGIFPFEGLDEEGNEARFNAQLITIRQIPESMPTPQAASASHLH